MTISVSVAVSGDASVRSLSIVKIQPASPALWDQIWEKCDYATYYHSREWAETWLKYFANSAMVADPKLVTFSDGKTALLPLVRQRVYWGLYSVYSCCIELGYGGWLSEAELEPEHANLLSRFLLKNLTNLNWRLNPYDPLTQTLEVGETCPDETYVIHLVNDFDQCFAKQSSSFRKVRKAEKAGVQITIANTLAEWQEYYQVYRQSLQRWGEKTISEHGWELFQALFERQSPYIRLWLAKVEGKIVSGAVCLYSKQTVAYWHGASLEEYFHLRPVNLLMYTIMRQARDSGKIWFDFGSSGGLESVANFKKSFGATSLSCPVICRGTRFRRVIDILIDWRKLSESKVESH
jgi:hypothetical protein